jgi:hypothetical protein
MAEDPIRVQTAYLLGGGRRNQAGTLLLYPDRLSHVASRVLAVAAARGVTGVLVATRVAKGKAPRQAAEGGKGVTTILLDQITGVRRARKGLNRHILEVTAADDAVARFGVRYDQWKPDLVAALRDAGRTVHDGGEVVTVTG